MLYRLELCLDRQERIENNIERNMQKLEEAVKTIRGVEVQVRPHAKKTGWYGDEIQIGTKKILQNDQIELDSKRPRF